jgi:hypothetical protein
MLVAKDETLAAREGSRKKKAPVSASAGRGFLSFLDDPTQGFTTLKSVNLTQWFAFSGAPAAIRQNPHSFTSF